MKTFLIMAIFATTLAHAGTSDLERLHIVCYSDSSAPKRASVQVIGIKDGILVGAQSQPDKTYKEIFNAPADGCFIESNVAADINDHELTLTLDGQKANKLWTSLTTPVLEGSVGGVVNPFTYQYKASKNVICVRNDPIRAGTYCQVRISTKDGSATNY